MHKFWQYVALLLLYFLAKNLKQYPIVKELFSDIYHFLSRVTRGSIRFFNRKAVEYDYSSKIDRLRLNFNDKSMNNLLPKCKVNWVTLNKEEGVIKNKNDVIVCMHLDDNYDTNMFNALHYYITSEMLPDTDVYVDATTLSAIRLMCIRVIIANQSKLLSIFNNLFDQQPEDVKSAIRKMNEIEKYGYFHKILVPCLSMWTEKILIELPNESHKNDADDLIEWTYYNSTINTKEDETFEFTFNKIYFKVALIVIANDEYFEKRQFGPYLRRAYYYSSENYDMIYLVSLGVEQGNRARRVSEILTKKPGFTIISKQHQTKIDKFYLLTCIAVKPNNDLLIDSAWKELNYLYKKQNKVRVLITDIHSAGIRVNFDGLSLDIDKDFLSSRKDIDHRLFFQKYDPLDLDIIELDDVNHSVVLSNAGLDTDPANFIEQCEGRVKEEIMGTIHKIIIYNNIETGVFVDFEDCSIQGYISKKNITRASYMKISDLVKIGDTKPMTIINYDIENKRYTCRLKDIYDPLSNDKLYVNTTYDLRVMSVSESGVSCTLYNGLKGFIPVSLFSWLDKSQNYEAISRLRKGETLKAKLIEIDQNKNKLIFNRKAIMENEVENFVINNKGIIFEGIIEIEAINHIKVRIEKKYLVFVPLRNTGQLKSNECSKNVGDKIKISIEKYDDLYENCVGYIVSD